ncbi:MAG TPA: MqnA/MqnD/SBP family protein [Polyangia bacterium]|nr:MqnA/MqnD/SBP family protein [Polyangia bacterium]
MSDMSCDISLAYSVDADDAFMFHAIQTGAVDTDGLTFSHRRADTAELNRLALAEAADVVAVSVGVYPRIAAAYQILPHGASVGRGYGPVVVAPRPLQPGQLNGLRVGIPGTTTTAWMVLRLIAPRAIGVEIPIAPFNRIFDAVTAGDVDAALLIHEGRLLYPSRGLHLVADLGVFWRERTGMPLPLGVNVIRRGLGPERVARVSSVLRASIQWAMAHRPELIARLASEDRGDEALKNPALIDEYLSLYANADTAALPEDGQRAVARLFADARAAGLIDAAAASAIDWAP